MKFTIKTEVFIDEYILQCAIAELLIYNRICKIIGRPEKKLNGKNVLAEIKYRIEQYGLTGLEDNWQQFIGTGIFNEAEPYVQAYPDLLS